MKEIFPVSGWGIATRKDYLLVDFSEDSLTAKFEDIISLDTESAERKYEIKQSPHWDFSKAKKKLPTDVPKSIHPLLFRPFDTRYVYYEPAMIERGDHRYSIMQNMLRDNLALISIRRVEVDASFNHVLCTNQLSLLHSVSMKEGNFVYPLYTYPTGDNLLDTDTKRRANLAPAFLAALTEQWDENSDNTAPTPEAIFHYLYAVLHAPAYRARYAQFLKRDFPRIPLPPGQAAFDTAPRPWLHEKSKTDPRGARPPERFTVRTAAPRRPHGCRPPSSPDGNGSPSAPAR